MSEKDEKLSAESSPKTVDLKKRARRINNWPLFITFIIVAIVVLTLGMVVVNRSNRAKADVAVSATGNKAATVHAKEFITISGGEGGIVGPKEEPPAPPPMPSPEPAKPPDSIVMPESGSRELKVPEQPKVTEELKKVREKRFRQVEQAIDGPIKVNLDDVRKQHGTVNSEMEALERQIAALGGYESQTYEQRLAAIHAATEGGGGANDYGKRDTLSRLNHFGEETRDWTNPATVEAPPVRHIIRTGSVIPATLISGINSDLPGQIIAQVAQDVFDTPTGHHVLIPQGSRLVGEYSSEVQYGQSRVFAVWQRIIYPDGKALDLGSMPGSTGAGYAGFKDRVNNHYIRIFGSAIMMSAILAGVEMTQNNTDYAQGSNQQRMSDAMSEALGQQLGGVMAEMLQKNMNIAPTLEIRPGYRFNVMLVKDLVFGGPYRSFDYTAE